MRVPEVQSHCAFAETVQNINCDIGEAVAVEITDTDDGTHSLPAHGDRRIERRGGISEVEISRNVGRGVDRDRQIAVAVAVEIAERRHPHAEELRVRIADGLSAQDMARRDSAESTEPDVLSAQDM